MWGSRFQSVLLAGCALALLAGLRLHAEFIKLEIENVPVDRLVRNLERLTRGNPKDVDSRFNLARVHAMAFAQKTKTAQVVKGDEPLYPWFGGDPAHVPFVSIPTRDRAALRVAKAHLAKAVDRYQEVIALDPAHLPARLGYAWCVDQSGEKNQAISAYRQVISEAWRLEQDLTFIEVSWHSVTAEAAGYLIRLLDPDKDREEIATLRERTAHMAKAIRRSLTPVVIPLGSGSSAAEFVNRSARVSFDADGSGVKKEWTWITPDAGWLVHAPRGQQVTSALQMFGSVAFWLFWDNGYQAMRALDDDGDGRLRGAELAGLAIWHDRNENGVAEVGEVKPLADWGVVSLSCRFQIDHTSRETVAFSPDGVTFADGVTRPTYDVLLEPGWLALTSAPFVARKSP